MSDLFDDALEPLAGLDLACNGGEVLRADALRPASAIVRVAERAEGRLLFGQEIRP